MIINKAISKYFCLGLLTLILIVLQLNWSLPFSGQKPLFAAVITETNSPTSLVQAGKEHYQAEQFTEAIALWQQAAKIFSQKGDPLNQAIVLTNLALAYQQLGMWIK